MTDEAIFERARRGDEAAFRTLYEKYRGPLFRFAWRMSGAVETAEDLTHDCFLSLFSSGFTETRGSLRTYLFGTIRNLARKRWRDHGREELTSEAADNLVTTSGALDLLLSKETAAAVQSAVDALPPLQKEVLTLFEYEDLPLDEIAGITGAEVGAVKSRLHRARESLRNSLARLPRTSIPTEASR